MHESRILVIDDSITIRAMVEELLSREEDFHRIAVAADIPAARALIQSFRPTLITLDLNLPGIGGLTFLDELSAYPHAPVVVLSSATKDNGPAAKEAIERGAHACFDKAKILSHAKDFLRVLRQAPEIKAKRELAKTRKRKSAAGTPRAEMPEPA